MQLTWRDEALRDLDDIYHYIAIENHNPESALKVVTTIYDQTNKTLIPHPMQGRMGRVRGTREFVISRYSNYIVVYTISDEDQEVQVISVRNTAREWPKTEQLHELVGYAIDGFGIYSSLSEKGTHIKNFHLDECHGHSHEIEWDGETKEMFHYHLTDAYPYSIGCVKGNVETEVPLNEK